MQQYQYHGWEVQVVQKRVQEHLDLGVLLQLALEHRKFGVVWQALEHRKFGVVWQALEHRKFGAVWQAFVVAQP